MTVDLFSKAVREALRETLPGNDNGGAGRDAPVRIEHSGTINVTITMAVAEPAVAPSGDLAPFRLLPQARIVELLADLNARTPVGQVWERGQPKRVVLNPTAEQRARAGGRPLR